MRVQLLSQADLLKTEYENLDKKSEVSIPDLRGPLGPYGPVLRCGPNWASATLSLSYVQVA